MKTIASAFDQRHNSLNALRLMLALLVIVAHSWPVGGYGPAPGYGDQDLGGWAVAGFFAISGYLITSSRLSARSVWDYLWRRFLRIYPAFLVSLVVVAFIIAPASSVILGESYSWGSGSSFVLSNSAVLIQQWGIDGTLESAPYPVAWNGSAWTLFHELLCYLAVGLLVTVISQRFLKPALIAALLACTMITVATFHFGFEFSSIVVLTARLGGFFAAGAILYLYRDKIPSHWLGAVVAALLLAGIVVVGEFQALAGLPVAYLMMYLGSILPLQKLGSVNDVSYGMYIYAFPVQQVLSVAFPDQQLPLPLFILLSIALTAPFAAASWFLLEKPLHRYRGLFSGQRRADPPVTAAQPQPVPHG